ncbi:MAG: hypothetical protein ACI4JM_13580 [Oscillospiraceae bacterium]
MKALIITAIILLIFAVSLNVSVIADISYIGGKLDYRVSYGFFKLYPFPFKKKKKIKSSKSRKKSDKSGKNERGKSENNLMDTIDTVIRLIEECADGIKKSARKIIIKNLYVSFIIRNDDACTCAVNYGIISGAVYTLVGIVSSLFKTSLKKISVGLEFNQPDSVYDFSFSLKLKLGTGIKTVLNILFKYIVLLYKKSKEK